MARAKTGLVPAEGKAVTGWADAVKAAAKKQVASVGFLGSSSRWISFKGGLIKVDGAVSRDGKMKAVVLDYMQTRTYHEDEYDGTKTNSPDCYAYGDDEGRTPVEPHEKSTDRQAKTCDECEWSKFNTADKGRGQKCRQHVRLALVPATDAGVTGEPFFAHIPPTSIKNVKGWLDQLGETPCFAAVTEISVTPSDGNMFDVTLDAQMAVPTKWQGAIIAALNKGRAEMREPYPEPEEAPKKPAAKKRGKF